MYTKNPEVKIYSSKMISLSRDKQLWPAGCTVGPKLVSSLFHSPSNPLNKGSRLELYFS